MYKDKKILALVPARGGSKGIKDKNIIPLQGAPLISYTINSALGSKYIDNTVVTTDSERIASVAMLYGASVPFMRPAELASDSAKTIDSVIHAVDTLAEKGECYDVLVLLQPTQPLRTSEDIDNAIHLFFENNRQSLVSVTPVENHPLLIRSINSDGELVSLLDSGSTCRRQDMDKYYSVNGCIYINNIEELSGDTSFNDNKIPYIMDKDRAVDIDDLNDLFLAEYYLQRKDMK